MNYYYDVLLNFNQKVLWNFYEWEENDKLVFMKKIPLFRVSFETMQDFLGYHIQINSSFCKKIIEEVNCFKEDSPYSFLISDSKNSLAVQFDEHGMVIGLSKLLLRDDNNLNEFIYTVPETEISYSILEKREIHHELRQYENMKNFVLVELNTLREEQNLHKLKYFYYELFQEEENDIMVMHQRMVQALESFSYDKLSKMNYFIRLSYHQV